MRFLSVCLALSILPLTIVSGQDAVKEKTAVKTTEVQLKEMTLKVPNTWKTAKGSSMRLATYAIPKAEGDDDNAELSIFSFGGGGGGVAANVTRWVGQFDGAGRTSKITKGMAGTNEYYFVDVSGTFKKPKPGSPPFRQETITAKGYRMLGVILVLKDKGVYYLKLAGPQKTIKAAESDFRNSFGGDSKTEKAYEL